MVNGVAHVIVHHGVSIKSTNCKLAEMFVSLLGSDAIQALTQIQSDLATVGYLR